jgi:hypothetical protein
MIPAGRMALAVLAAPLPLACLAALMLVLVTPGATFDEYVRIAGYSVLAALVLAGLTGVGPALLWLRDPQTPAVRWAFTGLIAGVASGVLLTGTMLIGFRHLIVQADMAKIVGFAFGLTMAFGFASALIARMLLRRYRR